MRPIETSRPSSPNDTLKRSGCSNFIRSKGFGHDETAVDSPIMRAFGLAPGRFDARRRRQGLSEPGKVG